MNEISTVEGRIDALGQALLRVVAELEVAQLIHGSRVSQAWRNARPERLADSPELQESRRVLLQLADLLDEARESRANR